MSSHHFVREGQEAALLALDWNPQLAQHASQLLEWQPQFIVTPEILEKVISEGLKPDAILGEPNFDYAFLQPIDIIDPNEFWANKKELNLLIEKPLEEITHYFDNKDICIFTSKYKVFVPKNNFNKWMPENHQAMEMNLLTKEIITLQRNKEQLFECQVKENWVWIEEI
jgi:thiamine pyrophosphokinase